MSWVSGRAERVGQPFRRRCRMVSPTRSCPRRYFPEGSMDKISPRTSTNSTRLHHYTGLDPIGVRGGSDALHPQALVEPNGCCVLGHDVEHHP